jgi:hypothetical protein
VPTSECPNRFSAITFFGVAAGQELSPNSGPGIAPLTVWTPAATTCRSSLAPAFLACGALRALQGNRSKIHKLYLMH